MPTSCPAGDAAPAAGALAVADSVAASAPRGPAHDVTLDGTSTNRNADAANGAAPGTTCNNPAVGKAATQNSQDLLLGAGPRAAGQFQLEPGRQRWPPTWPLPVAGVPGSADFGHAAALGPAG